MYGLLYCSVLVMGVVFGKYVKKCCENIVNKYFNTAKEEVEEDNNPTYHKRKLFSTPLVEGLNGASYLLIVYQFGYRLDSLIYCLVATFLLMISVIDWYTFEIPFILNKSIFIAGVLNLVIDYPNRIHNVFGFFVISVLLYLIYWVSRGAAIGGGDIKLMASAGLVLGASKIVIAFFVACVIGSIIHILRMKITKENHVLALGPYLAIGIYTTMLWGEQIIQWYLQHALQV
ncbi:prepilin peptidase [Anaerosporobacter faecicola]|uniref:prepilin peptidase n=1 Tax=Anaerosporobacter faecicola TaxID=2718714 RepID=UPI00143972B8|nr:A24 family peptidase [Anaerosporobacter faecicola]